MAKKMRKVNPEYIGTGFNIHASDLIDGIRANIKKAQEDLGGYTLWSGTQAEYDAITDKDDNTIYFIEE